MTREDAIDYLTRCADGSDFIFDCAVEVAIAALRAQAEVEKNEPLTLEELRGMDGQPVWMAFEGESYWDLGRCHNSEFFVTWRSGYLLWGEYGRTWLAYRRKLEEGQEKAPD